MDPNFLYPAIFKNQTGIPYSIENGTLGLFPSGDQFYYINSSGTISNFGATVQTGDFVTTGQTGAFLTTGAADNRYALQSATGNFVTTGQTGSFVTTGQTGQFVTGSVVRPSETGNFITASQTGQFVSTGSTGQFVTGSVVRPSSTGAFLTTGAADGRYALQSATGDFITTGQTGAFAAAAGTGAFLTTGAADGRYALQSATGSFVTTGQTGSFITTSQTGQFVATSQTGFLGKTAIGITIDGASAAITAGSKGSISIPYNCTLDSATLVADQVGSIVIDIKKSTYASFPTTTSIIGAGTKPTLSSAQKYTDSTLTNWTKTISAGDVLEYVVDSASTVTKVTLTLGATKYN